MLDLADGANPARIDSCAIGSCGWSVVVRDGYAYVGTNRELIIVDVTDPYNVTIVGRDSTAGNVIRSMTLLGDYAVLAPLQGSLELYDIHDPAQPARVSTFGPASSLYRGLAAAGEQVYVVGEAGLQVLRLMLPEAAATRPAAATEFRLEPAYPNPFNAATTLSFALPQAGEVELVVFDALGRRVTTLLQGMQAAGAHRVVWDAEGLPSGLYFARLKAGAAVRTQKLLLAR